MLKVAGSDENATDVVSTVDTLSPLALQRMLAICDVVRFASILVALFESLSIIITLVYWLKH